MPDVLATPQPRRALLRGGAGAGAALLTGCDENQHLIVGGVQQVPLGLWHHAPAASELRHWPAGTDPAQLVGLRKEFDTAQKILASLPGPRYRSTRIRGEGCEDADDIFFVLHPGQRLLRLRFPSNSLGVDVTVFQRRSSP